MITVSDFKFLMKEVAKDVRVELVRDGGEHFGCFEYSLLLKLDGEELLCLPLLREGANGDQWSLIDNKDQTIRANYKENKE